MQSAVVRSATRTLSRPATRLSSLTTRRFASDDQSAAAREASSSKNRTNAGGRSGSTFIFGIGAVVIAAVAGRYILASNKGARSGQIERTEGLNKIDDLSQHNHDPRDGGVKTIEQKKEKEAREAKAQT